MGLVITVVMFNMTHVKRQYHADCVQWCGDNQTEFKHLFGEKQVTFEIFQNHLFIRYDSGFYSLPPGYWLAVGENGEMRKYSDMSFNLRYEKSK